MLPIPITLSPVIQHTARMHNVTHTTECDRVPCRRERIEGMGHKNRSGFINHINIKEAIFHHFNAVVIVNIHHGYLDIRIFKH